MFIQLWMRLLGHAGEEANMFIQLWLRFTRPCCGRGYHVYTAMDEITRPCCGRSYLVYIAMDEITRPCCGRSYHVYYRVWPPEVEELQHCVKGLLIQVIAVQDTNIPRKVSKMCSLL